ncbi:MAG: hypothetical protein ACPGXZ_00475 [Saprospiraceae bacterium]
MKIIVKIALIVMLLGLNATLFAQTDGEDGRDGTGYEENDGDGDEDPFEESWKDRLVVGGSIFPGYSNGWILEATPMVGYRLTNTTIAGVGLNYSYRGFNDPYGSGWSSSTRMYGGRAFVMQDLFYSIFAQMEADYNYLTYKERDASDLLLVDQRYQSPGFLVGGGYSQGQGQLKYNLTILYDVLNGRNAIPRVNSAGGGFVFRGGIVFSL